MGDSERKRDKEGWRHGERNRVREGQEGETGRREREGERREQRFTSEWTKIWKMEVEGRKKDTGGQDKVQTAKREQKS